MIHWHVSIPVEDWTPERIDAEVEHMLWGQPRFAMEVVLHDPVGLYDPVGLWDRGWIGWREKTSGARVKIWTPPEDRGKPVPTLRDGTDMSYTTEV